MALIKCPECGKEISDKAVTCPYCGNPMGNGEQLIQEKTSITDVFPQKSYLKWAALLWLLFIAEIAILIVATPENFAIVYGVLGVNAVLAGIVLIKIVREIVREKKAKGKILKNVVAMLLCCSFLWLNGGILLRDTIGNSGTNAKAVSVCKDLQNRLKSPDSLQIHSITAKINQERSKTYFYIDYSAENSFGGVVRQTAMYRNGQYITWMDFTDEDTEVLSSDETVTIKIDASKIERKLK